MPTGIEEQQLINTQEYNQLSSNRLENDFSLVKKKFPDSANDIKDIIKNIHSVGDVLGQSQEEITNIIKKISIKIALEGIDTNEFGLLKNISSDDWKDILQNDDIVGYITTYLQNKIKDQKHAEEIAKIDKNIKSKKEIATQTQERVGEKKQMRKKDQETAAAEKEILNREVQSKIESIRGTNNSILNYLQKTPLNLSDEQLASVKTTLSEKGNIELIKQGITDPEKTYKQYVYALQNPDQMPADMKNILAGQDSQELLAQFNADYGAQALAEKTVDRRTYAKGDPDRKMDGSVTMPNDRPRNKVSFRGAFAAFERQYFDPENKLQKLLNTSMNTHLGEEWMRKEEAGIKGPKTLQDGLEDISLTYLQQQTLNFQEFGRKDIQYLLQGVVKEDKMKQTGAAIIKFTKACKENPNLFMVLQNTPLNKLTEEQKQMKTNMIVLNRIIQQRFLKETQHVAKKQVAEMYFGQIADAMDAGGENIIMDTDMDAVTYDDKGNMIIKYHTQKGIAGQMVISSEGKVTITDIGAKQGTGSADKNNNIMQRATYTLPGKLVPLDAMMQRVASHKDVFVDAWKENLSQNTYDTTVFQEAVELKQNKLRALSDDQLRTRDLVHAGLDHTLHTTRVYNSLINFVTPYQEGQQDPVFDYFAGKTAFVDKGQYNNERGVSRYESLFAIRDMCSNSGSQTIERFEFAVQRLQQLYAGLPKEQNPFFNEFAKNKIWQLFDYFRTTDQSQGGFDVQAFENFVQQLTAEKPQNITTWLTAREDRLALIPLQSPHHKQLETAYADKTSEEFLSQNLDKAYPSKR